MPDKKSAKTIKVAGFVILVFIVGVAGVLTGHVIRGKMPRSGKTEVTMRPPMSLLNEGAMFPDVAVAGEDGATIQTVQMIGAAGCVVLFLDLECPPCDDMTTRWQRAFDDGVISHDQLWGVTYYSRQRVDAYINEHGVTFPIAVDTAKTFMHKYELKRFPMEVVVGASGRIRATNFNSAVPIDGDRLADWLSD